MTTKKFVWDPITDNVAFETNLSSSITVSYQTEPEVYGKAQTVTQSSQTFSYLYDGEGSTRQLTEASEAIANTYTYSAYGELVATTGTTKNSLQYKGAAGYYTNEETNDQYVRARTYDPMIGRWLSKDPLGFVDGMSLYAGYFVPNHADSSGTLVDDDEKKEIIIHSLSKYHKDFHDVYEFLREKSGVDNCKCVKTLIFDGHGQPKGMELADTSTEKRERQDWYVNRRFSDKDIHKDNVTWIAAAINTAIGRKWCQPCSIIMAGCNTGNQKGQDSWPFQLAKKTGCVVYGTCGFLSDDWKVSKYYRKSTRIETDEQYGSQAGKWRRFSPQDGYIPVRKPAYSPRTNRSPRRTGPDHVDEGHVDKRRKGKF